MTPYMSGTKDKSPVYNLYAVVVHLDIMNAAFSGHYVCYVKNIRGEWFRTDDSRVRAFSRISFLCLIVCFPPLLPTKNEILELMLFFYSFGFGFHV
jgi:hypothetical protein